MLKMSTALMSERSISEPCVSKRRAKMSKKTHGKHTGNGERGRKTANRAGRGQRYEVEQDQQQEEGLLWPQIICQKKERKSSRNCTQPEDHS